VADTRIDLTADRTNARAFLERLANDKRFRTAVTKNPAKKLGEYGIKVDPKSLPARLTADHLPTPGQIRSLLDKEPLAFCFCPEVHWFDGYCLMIAICFAAAARVYP
jgi:hypothetical protein